MIDFNADAENTDSGSNELVAMDVEETNEEEDDNFGDEYLDPGESEEREEDMRYDSSDDEIVSYSEDDDNDEDEGQSNTDFQGGLTFNIGARSRFGRSVRFTNK